MYVLFILFCHYFFTLFGDITICRCGEETEQQLNYLDHDQAVPLFGTTIVSMTLQEHGLKHSVQEIRGQWKGLKTLWKKKKSNKQNLLLILAYLFLNFPSSLSSFSAAVADSRTLLSSSVFD